MPARYVPPKALLVALLLLCGSAVAADEDLCGPVAEPLPAPTLSANADPNQIQVTSDGAELSRTGDAHLKGNVEVRQGERQIAAQDVVYDSESRNFKVEGDVEYQDSQVRVHGTSGSYDPLGGARFGPAEFELPLRPARGTAEEIAVKPDGQVILQKVEYTTCPVGNSDWQLRASNITLDTQSRSGSGRGVRLDFKGVPILYTPFISFPLGDQRKSGFLFPDFGHSNRSGVELSVPYYLNLAPNYDLTLTPHLLLSRGLELDTAFRYLTERRHGELSVSYLPNDSLRDRDRSLVHWVERADFARDWRFTADAANVSDNEYFEDFGAGPEGTSVTYLERNAELSYYGQHWSLLGQLQNFQVIDLSIPDSARPYSSVPRLLTRGLWEDGPLGLSYELNSELAYFLRQNGLSGTRLDVEPELRWPLVRPGYHLIPAAAFRYTRYELDNTTGLQATSPSRDAPILSLDAGMIFERPAGRHGTRLQTLEPRLLYLYVPFREQSELPVFDTGLPDLNLVQLFRRNRYVGADRLSDSNQLSFGLTSRLLDTDSGQQFLSATFGQTYYFESPRVTLPDEQPSVRDTSNMIAQVALTAYRNWNFNLGYEWDPEESRSVKSELGLQYRPAGDSVINLGYRFRRDLLEQVDASAAWPVTPRWNLFARMVYSLREDTAIEQFAGFEYASCCWRLRVVQRRYVSSRTGERDTSVAVQLELTGLSSVGVPADAFLERSIRGYSRDRSGPPSQLPTQR